MLLDLPVPRADDGDLDLDLHQVRVTHVGRCGDGFVVRTVGEQAPTQLEITVEPFQVVASAGQLAGAVARQLAAEVSVIVARLESWSQSRTPLRLLAAPGKHLALVAPDGDVVPLPCSA